MKLAVSLAIGALLAGRLIASCRMRRSMAADDSPGDRLASNMTVAALTEYFNGDKTMASVVAWRIEQLTDAGFDELRAATLATVHGTDWRRAIELVEQGCPHKTAADLVL